MMISTKGRYALRVMLDLALCGGEDYISLKDVAGRQGISMKYLEAIVSMLSKSGLLEGKRGKNGGYRLCRRPEEYTIASILSQTEGCLAPVSCLNPRGNLCARASDCLSLPLWQGLDSVINSYLESVTLADLINKNRH